MNTPARTRFAPSPTGFLHVGGVRTALFAWLIAQQTKGQFILRFEDTDQKREVAGAREHLIESLKALNLFYDEGPDIGGDYGPYMQSIRLNHYQKWAEKLIKIGRAYADPYSAEEVQGFREQAQKEKRAFLYRHFRPENPPIWDGSQPLRFKSDPKAYRWHDEVMGDLSTGPEIIDDFVLIKSDGFPTYNFAHIVDDAEMKISHVIRGQEFLSSTPNYLNLYEALDMQRPLLATAPHVLGPSGTKKLSKRDGAKDVLDYIRDGFLPEALISFIATLGWNDGTEQEIFTQDELKQKFSLNRIQRSGARFDEQRLLWVNGQFIRQLSVDELLERTYDFRKDGKDFWPETAATATETYKKQVLGLVQDRLKTLADLPDLTTYFFAEPEIDWGLIDTNKQLKKLSKEDIKAYIQAAYEALTNNDFSPETLQETLNQLLETTGQKPGTLFSLIRIATTWAPFSPALNETLALLDKEKTLARLSATLAKLA
jgi:glutamyl-tRNA synthetase